MGDLHREYERARFPEYRRLDVHGEGPDAARERAFHWIQSHAHESPGSELLLIVERGSRPGRPPSPVTLAVTSLLVELKGRLIDWWQPFAPGSLALRISEAPSVLTAQNGNVQPESDGRTDETAGAARPPPQADIPAELLDSATRAAELRISREGLSTRILDVVLREIWIEAQAVAMEERLSFETAITRILDFEVELAFQE